MTCGAIKSRGAVPLRAIPAGARDCRRLGLPATQINLTVTVIQVVGSEIRNSLGLPEHFHVQPCKHRHRCSPSIPVEITSEKGRLPAGEQQPHVWDVLGQTFSQCGGYTLCGEHDDK